MSEHRNGARPTTRIADRAHNSHRTRAARERDHGHGRGYDRGAPGFAADAATRAYRGAHRADEPRRTDGRAHVARHRADPRDPGRY